MGIIMAPLQRDLIPVYPLVFPLQIIMAFLLILLLVTKWPTKQPLMQADMGFIKTLFFLPTPLLTVILPQPEQLNIFGKIIRAMQAPHPAGPQKHGRDWIFIPIP